MRKTFKERRDLFLEKLSEVQGLKLNKPEGAFYLFPDVSAFFGKSFDGRKVNNVGDLCEFILEDSLVATTPGDAFGCPNNIRLSYANSNEQLIEAAKRIKQSLEKLS
jgi:aspartate aminotransferase